MGAGLLRLVGGAELGTLLAMLAVFIGHGLWVGLTDRPRERRRVELRQGLVRAVGGERGLAAPTSRRDSRLSHQALEELASSVSGNGAAWIEQTAREMGLFNRAQRWCRSRRWWLRLRGVRSFGLLGAGAELVPARLNDAHPLVREAATRWLARHPSTALVERLVEMLDDPEPRCRLTAQDTLIRLGATSVEPLSAYLSRVTTPGRVLALKVATGLADARFLNSGLRAAGDSDPVVRAQAATLLAAVAGGRVEKALLALLDDPDESVRIAATRGLGVLSSWELAPNLAQQLSDSAWGVRREAALALRRLGPAGRLYLRRALVGPDPYAADMARQMLDLPNANAD